jgi:hypothetical protein
MHSGATGGLNMPVSFHSTVWAPVLLLVFQPTRAFPPIITSTLGPPPPRRAPALTKAEKWCVQTPCSLWFSLLQLGRRDPWEFPLFPIQGEQCHQQPFPRFSVVRWAILLPLSSKSCSRLWCTSLAFFPSLRVNYEAQRAAIHHKCRVAIDNSNRTSSPPSTSSWSGGQWSLQATRGLVELKRHLLRSKLYLRSSPACSGECRWSMTPSLCSLGHLCFELHLVEHGDQEGHSVERALLHASQPRGWSTWTERSNRAAFMCWTTR